MNETRQKMVRHAYETVPVYRNLLQKRGISIEELDQKDGWGKVPLIEKTNVALCADQMISEEYLGLLVTGKLIRTRTSGSTGTYMDVYWEESNYQCSLFPLWMERWKTAKVHPRDKVCIFNTVLPGDEKYCLKKNTLIFSKSNLNDERLREIYFQMLEFSPKWILIHPGIAALLCDLVEKEQFPALSSVVYVELTGEMVLDQLKRRIEKDFSCQVKSHYGTMEVSTIGYEEGEYYKIYETSTYVEVLDENGKPVPEGETGNIYVTSLHNYAMPFVRYGTGDRGQLFERETNGKKEVLLKLTKARKNDFLCLPDGTKIPPDILMKPIEMLNEVYENVVFQFQVRQTEADHLVLNVVMDNEFMPEDFVQFYKEVLTEPWVYEMEFEFKFLEQIQPELDTGKVCWFSNEMEGVKK